MGSRPIRSTSTACRNSWQPEQRPSTRRVRGPTECSGYGCRCAAACLVSFFWHREIYRSDVERKRRERECCPPRPQDLTLDCRSRWLALSQSDRVGGRVTPAVLPHHRTCRSASGGS